MYIMTATGWKQLWQVDLPSTQILTEATKGWRFPLAFLHEDRTDPATKSTRELFKNQPLPPMGLQVAIEHKITASPAIDEVVWDDEFDLVEGS